MGKKKVSLRAESISNKQKGNLSLAIAGAMKEISPDLRDNN